MRPAKRFHVWVSRRGDLTATPAGALPIRPREWQLLVTVNRPISSALVRAAYGRLVRIYKL